MLLKAKDTNPELRKICQQLVDVSFFSDIDTAEKAAKNLLSCEIEWYKALNSIFKQISNQVVKVGYAVDVSMLITTLGQSEFVKILGKRYRQENNVRRIKCIYIEDNSAEKHVLSSDEDYPKFFIDGVGSDPEGNGFSICWGYDEDNTKRAKVSISKMPHYPVHEVPEDNYYMFEDLIEEKKVLIQKAKEKNKKSKQRKNKIDTNIPEPRLQIHGVPFIEFKEGRKIYCAEHFLEYLKEHPRKYGKLLSRYQDALNSFEISKDVLTRIYKDAKAVKSFYLYSLHTSNYLPLYSELKPASKQYICSKYTLVYRQGTLFLRTEIEDCPDYDLSYFHVSRLKANVKVEVLFGDYAYARLLEIIEIIREGSINECEEYCLQINTTENELMDFLKKKCTEVIRMAKHELRKKVLNELKSASIDIRNDEDLIYKVKKEIIRLGEKKEALLSNLRKNPGNDGISDEELMSNNKDECTKIEEFDSAVELYKKVIETLQNRIEIENQICIKAIKDFNNYMEYLSIQHLYREIVDDKQFVHYLVRYKFDDHNILAVATDTYKEGNDDPTTVAYILSPDNIEDFYETVADAFENNVTDPEGVEISSPLSEIANFLNNDMDLPF